MLLFALFFEGKKIEYRKIDIIYCNDLSSANVLPLFGWIGWID